MEYINSIKNEIKLFCLPYAGGSAAVYNKWKLNLDSRIDLVPLELSGRGRRIKEPFYNSMMDCAEDMFAIIRNKIFDTEYALYGHSMGTLIIYELMNRLRENGLRKPLHIFLSGRYPPHIEDKQKISQLPDSGFIDEILKLGGTPKELCENKELIDIFIPIIKSDYRIVEEYQYKKCDGKWDTGISAMTGLDDESVSLQDVYQWVDYTERECNIYTFPGDHFFIHNYSSEIIAIINKTLCKDI